MPSYDVKMGNSTITINSEQEISEKELGAAAYNHYTDYSVAMDEDGDYVFDKLLEVPAYRDALIKRWELTEGKSRYGNQPDKKWDGNIEDLRDMQEESFEEFNDATNNEGFLAAKALQIAGMSDGEKEALDTLYDGWARTAITGEGSRSIWQQMADAGTVLLAPSTWLGGRLITGPAMRAGAKLVLKKALAGGATKKTKKLAAKVVGSGIGRGAIAGAAYGGAFDAGEQLGIAMNLNEDVEYDPSRTMLTAAAGAALGGVVGGVVPLGGGMIGRKAAKQKEITRKNRLRARDAERKRMEVDKQQELNKADDLVRSNIEEKVLSTPLPKQQVSKKLTEELKVEAKRLEEDGLNKQQAKQQAHANVTGGYKVGELVNVSKGNFGLAKHAATLKKQVVDVADANKEIVSNKKELRKLKARARPNSKARKAAIQSDVKSRIGDTKGRRPEALKRDLKLHTQAAEDDYNKGIANQLESLAKRNAELTGQVEASGKAARQLGNIENGYVPKEFDMQSAQKKHEFKLRAEAAKQKLGWVSPTSKTTDEQLIKVLAPEELAQIKMGKVSPELKQKLDSGPLPPRELYVPQKLDDLSPLVPIEKTLLQKTVGDTNQQLRSKYPWFDNLMGSISTRAAMIHGPLGLMFQRADRITIKLAGELVPTELKLKALSREVKRNGRSVDFDLAWHNEDWAALRSIYKEVTGDSMESFEKELKKTFRDRQIRKSHTRKVTGYRDDYLPRNVKDFEGLMNYMDTKTRGKVSFRTLYDQAKEQAAKKLGVKVEQLSQEVQDSVLTDLIQHAKNPGKKKFVVGTGHDKKRSISKVDQEMLQFYDSPLETFSSWNRRTAADVGETEFFKGHAVLNKDGDIILEDSIGSMVNRMDNVASVDQLELRKLIEARFMNGRQPAGKFMQNYRNAIYLTTLANPMSALTQLADLPMGLIVNGLRDSIQVLLHPGRGPSARDMHLMHVLADEFSNETKMAHILHKAFKWSGFMSVDEMGKNFILKGAYNRLTRLSKTAKGRKELARKYGRNWGGDLDQLIKDAASAKDGEATDLMEMFLWQELAGVQPIGPSELPTAWHNNPNARVMYALKSFTLKQLDFMRRNIVHEWARGNHKEAVGKAVMYLSLIPTGNMAVGELKNFVRYGEVSDKEQLASLYGKNVLSIAGMNKYALSHVQRGDVKRGVAETFLPPIPVAGALFRDMGSFLDPSFTRAKNTLELISNLELTREVPLLGRNLADNPFFGDAVEDWKKREEKRFKEKLK